MISTESSQVSNRLLEQGKYPCLFVGPCWINGAAMVGLYSSPEFRRLRSAEIIIYLCVCVGGGGEVERFLAPENRMLKFLRIMFDLDGMRVSYVDTHAFFSSFFLCWHEFIFLFLQRLYIVPFVFSSTSNQTRKSTLHIRLIFDREFDHRCKAFAASYPVLK